MIYKVSYVVRDGTAPGSIKNEPERPTVGDTVRIGKFDCQVIDVYDIMPPRDDFQYLHAVVEPVVAAQQA
ncbi:MAG: hypothetical protein AAFN11_20505 [Chloroflexota bacterium]